MHLMNFWSSSMHRNTCRLIFCIHFLSSVIYGQTNHSGTIRGMVINESTRRPVEFVTIVLQKRSDSVLVTGTVTDKNGKFELTNVPNGEYVVKCRFISYKEKMTAPFKIDSLRTNMNIGTINLVETTVNLDEVLVTSQKALFNNSIDRKVYNVDQDVLSKAGSVSEILQNIPSVEVDIDGNVSLRGTSGVLIMINGKNSLLMGKNSATVLQQMPASSIEKIEVITNPSAKFKPDGASGIINIVLKKNTKLGYNGSVGVNAGNHDRYNANIRLNYNPGEYNIFGSYAIRKDNRTRINTDTREETDSASHKEYYREDMSSFGRPLSHMVALGGDYKFDQFNSTGLTGSYFYNSITKDENSISVLQNSNRIPLEDYTRKRWDPEFEKEYEAKFFFQHDFPKEDHTLRVEYNLSQQWEQEDNHYTNLHRVPAGYPITYDNTLIIQDEKKNELTVDYSNPLSEYSTFEAGYSGEFNNLDLDFSIDSLHASLNRIEKDTTKSNRFILDETIHAFYATVQHSFGNFGFLAGVRAEQAFIKSHLVTHDTTIHNDYLGLYPTMHLSYKLGEEYELQLNYSRRIRAQSISGIR
jgi:hypothetical protein